MGLGQAAAFVLLDITINPPHKLPSFGCAAAQKACFNIQKATELKLELENILSLRTGLSVEATAAPRRHRLFLPSESGIRECVET